MIRRIGVNCLALAVVLAIVSVASQAAPQPMMTRHARGQVVNGEAQSLGRMPASQTMNFDIVLALRHAPELQNFLQDIYDPSSSNYRHFVTPEEFTARFGPSQEDWDATVRFARENGFKVIGGTRDGMDLQLRGTVGQVEKAFHVQIGLYQHPTENRTFFAPDREPSVDLPFQLWHVTGLDNYSVPRPALGHRNDQIHVHSNIKGSCPNNSYCGSDMRAAYYGSGPLTGSGQNIGLLEFLGYDIADLNTYFKNIGQTNSVTVTGVSADGSSLSCTRTQGCDDREQILDMTQAISMAPGISTLFVFVSDSSDTAMLSSMSTNKPLPAQLSSSWTWQPADPSDDDPFFQKFAAQGQNYFQAAGDSGAYTSTSQFVFPADDDFVTTVGGTDLQTSSAGGAWASETAWNDGGGGFFTVDAIPIPSWQQTTGVITSKNEGSTTLRNAPDVAAESNFDFYTCADQEACQTGWGGTSFAAPMWAGYMALVNQQAVANGHPTLGFINPAVYTLGLSSGYSAAFHDTTTGSNGFPAVAGYDLATGWGSPNGAGLINALAGTGGGGGGITFNPTSLKWGKIAVHSTGGAKKVVVTNSGSGTLTISNIATTGDFALVTVKKTKKVTPCTNGISLAVGATCEIKVSFTPTQTGLRTGDVNFTDNASGSPQSVALSGTGK